MPEPTPSPRQTLSYLMRLFEDEAYIIWKAHSDAIIILKQGCTPVDQLKAWTQALLLAQSEGPGVPDSKLRDDTSGDRLAELRTSLEKTRRIFDTHEVGLRNVGWDLDTAALETRAGKRLQVETKED